jgi:hypothetical protein
MRLEIEPASMLSLRHTDLFNSIGEIAPQLGNVG